MTTTDPPTPENGDEAGVPPDVAGDEPADRVAALRGAGVGGVDTRRLGQMVVGVIIATLAVLVVTFTFVGVHKNQQDDRLHNDGVPVTFTVSACTGLVGGSGSNPVGYVCHGSYSLDGHTYREQLPGNDYHRNASTVPAIAVPGDPALVSPAAMVATEHSSSGVYVVPVILFVILVVLVAWVLLRWRRTHAVQRADQTQGGQAQGGQTQGGAGRT
jgi:uncharacterized membrane protein